MPPRRHGWPGRGSPCWSACWWRSLRCRSGSGGRAGICRSRHRLRRRSAKNQRRGGCRWSPASTQPGRALATADTALLDEVYLPQSAPALADLGTIEQLAARGWTIPGAGARDQQCHGCRGTGVARAGSARAGSGRAEPSGRAGVGSRIDNVGGGPAARPGQPARQGHPRRGRPAGGPRPPARGEQARIITLTPTPGGLPDQRRRARLTRPRAGPINVAPRVDPRRVGPRSYGDGMRLLHTSDWHLGRTFHGQSLLADQEKVLAALADLAAEHAVDAVLVSGDLYDRAVPSPETVQSATRILRRIRDAGIVIVAISGNHDSAPRLGAFTDFLAAGGLHLRTRWTGSPIRCCCPMPPDRWPSTRCPTWSRTWRAGMGVAGAGRSPAGAGRAMRRARPDLATRPAGTRSVVLAHAFVVGAVAGGSERSIAVGGVESVTAEVFDGFDYVALGHLHRPQVVSERVRYSGSPMPYAFSEAGYRKSVWLIDLDAPERCSDRRPPGRPSARHGPRSLAEFSAPQQVSPRPTCLWSSPTRSGRWSHAPAARGVPAHPGRAVAARRSTGRRRRGSAAAAVRPGATTCCCSISSR